MKSLKVVGIAACILLIAGFVFSISRTTRSNAPKNSAPAQPVPAAPAEWTAQARVEALRSIPVPVAIAGEIDSFSSEVGQDVFEGQILARISNQGLQTGLENSQRILQNAETKLATLETTISAARLEAVRSRDESVRATEDLALAAKEFERQRTLNEAGATPRKTYEKSVKDYESAKSEAGGLAELAHHAAEHVDDLTKEYDLTKKTLEDKRKELEEAQAAVSATEVRAPAGGIVVARQGEIGKTITQEEASALFRIATDISALQAVFIPDASRAMKPGDPVSITFTDVPGDAIPAVIRDVKNGQATAQFTSANPAIRPGMSCIVHGGIK